MGRLPDASKLSYSKEAIRKAAKRPALPDGWYPFVSSEPKRSVLDKGEYAGAMTINVTSAALADENNPATKVKPTQRDGTFLPLDNPEWPGHEAPSWAWGMATDFFAAMYKDGEKVKSSNGKNDVVFYNTPKWKDGDLWYKGKKVKSEDEDKLREEALATVADLAILLWGDEKAFKDLKDRFYYGQVGFRKEGDRFKNIIDRKTELGPDDKLVDLTKAEGVSGAKQNRPATTGKGKKKAKRGRRK
jgi:hypothetical protein